jgi:hypothetical protein|tara:strand:- start:20071 stop:20559 length:489 start_codon:yes stop_codon:yes gene_type:complete
MERASSVAVVMLGISCKVGYISLMYGCVALMISSSDSRSSKFNTGCTRLESVVHHWGKTYEAKTGLGWYCCTYRTWRRRRYRRLIWGLIKRSLCLFLALLKPIVKVPKIIVSFPALLKLVEITKTIIVCRKVVIVVIFRRVCASSIKGRVVCGIVFAYGRPI